MMQANVVFGKRYCMQRVTKQADNGRIVSATMNNTKMAFGSCAYYST